MKAYVGVGSLALDEGLRIVSHLYLRCPLDGRVAGVDALEKREGSLLPSENRIPVLRLFGPELLS